MRERAAVREIRFKAFSRSWRVLSGVEGPPPRAVIWINRSAATVSTGSRALSSTVGALCCQFLRTTRLQRSHWEQAKAIRTCRRWSLAGCARCPEVDAKVDASLWRGQTPRIAPDSFSEGAGKEVTARCSVHRGATALCDRVQKGRDSPFMCRCGSSL